MTFQKEVSHLHFLTLKTWFPNTQEQQQLYACYNISSIQDIKQDLIWFKIFAFSTCLLDHK